MYDNFWQPYATPYQTRYNAPQQAFGSKLEVIRVNGKNGAEAFQMPPNSSIILLDESAPLIWLKMTDGAGYPAITPYRIEPLTLAGESEFLMAVNGKCGDAVWRIMDELAETVKLLHPRVYESVLKKLNDL